MATGNRMGAKMQPCLTPEVVETLDDSFCPTLIPYGINTTPQMTQGVQTSAKTFEPVSAGLLLSAVLRGQLQ